MNSETTLKPVDHPSAWRASDSEKSTFAFDLTERHLAALDRALQSVKQQTDDAESISREQFALDEIADDVAAWRDQVMEGYGLIILRGFPIAKYSKEELGMIHFGLGTHFGTAMSQSVMGDTLGHVVNVGGKDPKERAYRNSTELDMHTDACDVVAMMCLQKAIEGGYSGYVSSVSIYNEALRRAPELMPILMRGFHYHRFGEEEPGQSPVTETPIPVFSFYDGYLSVNYLRAYIDMAADEMGQPLSDEEIAALDLIDDIAHDENFALKFITEPGEAIFFNNLTMLHNRTAFEDADQPELKRHFLRLWLVAHEPRPACDELRIYEGRGISRQEGKSTYFESDKNFGRFESEDGRM